MTKKILDVPKVKQLKNHCGPASLSIVFAYYGLSMDQKKIAEEITDIYPTYKKNPIIKRGTDASHIVGYSRKKGFVAYRREKATIDDLIILIDKDIPPIVNTDYITERDAGHFSVITGYDLKKRKVYFNDPYNLRRSNFTFLLFETLWKAKESRGDKRRCWNEFVSIRQK